MKRVGAAWLVGILLLGLTANRAQAGPSPGSGGGGGVVLIEFWESGFESGDFAAWTSHDSKWTIVTSATAAYQGLKGADIAGGTAPDSDVLLLQQPTTGLENVEVEYWWKVRNALETEDLVQIQWTPDGANWITLDTHTAQTAGEWVRFYSDLPAEADDNANFGLRVIADLGSSSDRMAFDNFSLAGNAVEVPEPASLALLSLGGLTIARRRWR